MCNEHKLKWCSCHKHNFLMFIYKIIILLFNQFFPKIYIRRRISNKFDLMIDLRFYYITTCSTSSFWPFIFYCSPSIHEQHLEHNILLNRSPLQKTPIQGRILCSKASLWPRQKWIWLLWWWIWQQVSGQIWQTWKYLWQIWLKRQKLQPEARKTIKKGKFLKAGKPF